MGHGIMCISREPTLLLKQSGSPDALRWVLQWVEKVENNWCTCTIPHSIPHKVSEFHMTVEEIKDHLRRIRSNVASANHQQGQFNLLYSRDYHNVVNTLGRANLWGWLHLGMTVATALMQVLIVKGLFDEKYSVRRMVAARR